MLDGDMGATSYKTIQFLIHLFGEDTTQKCVSVCDFCKCSDSGVKIRESYKWDLYLAGLGVIKCVCEISYL